MRPTHCFEGVKRISHEVRYVPKWEPIVLLLRLQVLLGILSDFWVFLGMAHFEVAIQNQESWRHNNQEQSEQEVLDQERNKFARADSLFLDKQVVLAAALLTVDALVADNVRSLAVNVHLLAPALARLAKLGWNLQILQVRQLRLQVLLHLSKQLC